MLKNKKILYTTLTMMICSFILSLILFCGCGSGPGTPGNSPNLVNISTVSTSTPNPTAGPVEITPTNGPTSTPTVEPTVGPTATPTVYIEQSGSYFYFYEPNQPRPSGVTPENPNNHFNASFMLNDSADPLYNIADLNIDSVVLKGTDGFPVSDIGSVEGDWALDSSFASGKKYNYTGGGNLTADNLYDIKVYFCSLLSHSDYFGTGPDVKLYLYSNGAEVGYVTLLYNEPK